MPIPGVTGSSDNRQPDAPTIGAATAANASVSIAFTAPTNTGKPNTSLTYTATTTPGSFTGTASSSPVVVSGLSNGTSYTAVVKLNNTVQDSLNSAATSSFTPSAPAPFFPPFFPSFTAPPFFPFFPPFFPYFPPPFFPFFPSFEATCPSTWPGTIYPNCDGDTHIGYAASAGPCGFHPVFGNCVSLVNVWDYGCDVGSYYLPCN